MRKWQAAVAALFMAMLTPPSARAATWYFCDQAGAYYPQVQTCPSGWREILAGQSSPSPARPLTREEDAARQRHALDDEKQYQAFQERRRQEMDDNRALLKTQWAPLLKIISGIQTVVTCEIYSDTQTANEAIRAIAGLMYNQKGEIGLAADTSMVVMDYVNQAISDGTKALSPAVCASAKANMPPADRAQMRQEIFRYAHM